MLCNLQTAIAAGLGGFNVLGVGILSSMLTDPGEAFFTYKCGRPQGAEASGREAGSASLLLQSRTDVQTHLHELKRVFATLTVARSQAVVSLCGFVSHYFSHRAMELHESSMSGQNTHWCMLVG